MTKGAWGRKRAEVSRENPGAAHPEAQAAVSRDLRPLHGDTDGLNQTVLHITGMDGCRQINHGRAQQTYTVQFSTVEPHLIKACQVEHGRIRPSPRDRGILEAVEVFEKFNGEWRT